MSFLSVMDRYLQRQLWLRVIFGFLLFLLFTLMVVYVMRLVQLYGKGAPADLLVQQFFCRLVMVSSMCIPMGMLVSALLVFGRLSADSEIVAFQASGIPVMRVMGNAFAIGAVLTLVGLALNEFAVPWAGDKKTQLDLQIRNIVKRGIDDELGDTKRAIMVPDYDENGHLVRAIVTRRIHLDVDEQHAELDQPTYIQYDEEGRATQVINADRAEWIKGSEWKFFNTYGTTISRDLDQRTTKLAGGTMTLTFNRTPSQLRKAKRDPETMSIRELAGMIQQTKRGIPLAVGIPLSLREMEVSLHQKFAIPAATFIFALIGAPLAIRPQRGGTALGVGLSLLIILLYYFLHSVTVEMGNNGNLPPPVAAWFANGVGVVVGGFLAWRASG